MEWKVIVPESAEKWIKIQRTKLTKPYAEAVYDDYKEIEPFLPKDVNTILDIGCGLAGIDVFLRERYPNATIMLKDGDGMEVFYGWNERCKFYNSILATEEFLKANGVEAFWHCGEMKADLVISLYSWGFHYPLSTYDVSGYIIADLRKKNEEPRGTIISETKKKFRCAWTQ